MESRIRTGSSFRAQGAVKRKPSNGNPDTTDWFRLEVSSSGNFARERIGNVATVGADKNVLGTERLETHISHPFSPLLPHLLSVFLLLCFQVVLCLESERVVRVGAWAQSFSERSETGCVIRA